MTAEMPADTRAWLDRSLDNRKWAQYNLDGGYVGQACFAAQQSVEMLLKAFLLAHATIPPKTHDLVRLLGLCADHERSIAAFEDAARTLDQYYVSTRYVDLPSARSDYSSAEASDAIAIVDRLMTVLQPAIESKLQETD